MWEKTRQAWLGSTREADVELKFDVGERMRETDRQTGTQKDLRAEHPGMEMGSWVGQGRRC